jgi:hypothetical protein
MANHGYVTTRKKMTPEAITGLLNRLNQERFKGILVIEYSHHEGDDGAYGRHLWEITFNHTVPEQSVCYGNHRVCWLNTSRKFEIRHGGGGNFIWWIDHIITNEIAVAFNGSISDDGVGGRWNGEEGKFPSYRNYIEHMWRHSTATALVKNGYIQEELNEVPEGFRE